MQTHDCRLKLDAAGEHSPLVRVAICVAVLFMFVRLQHKESIPDHLLPIQIILIFKDIDTH